MAVVCGRSQRLVQHYASIVCCRTFGFVFQHPTNECMVLVISEWHMCDVCVQERISRSPAAIYLCVCVHV